MSVLKSLSNALTVITLLAAPTMALAHEGEDHGTGTAEAAPLKGTVDSFADGKLVVRASDGKVTNVHVDDSTVFENGGAAAKAEDLKAGTRVVVHGEAMDDGTLHAKKVRFGKTAKK